MKHNKPAAKSAAKKPVKTQGKNTLSFLGIPLGKIPKGACRK
jgi:hypothetical protein